jgi:GNAT superfamily N-acetyltransferase
MLRLIWGRGNYADYQQLKRFHYLDRRPATVAGVVSARAVLNCGREELAGVLVLSYPVPFCRERAAAFGLEGMTLRERLAWANGHVRCISRVIVHPRFRGLSVATGLVREAIAQCGVEFVEAHARLARAMPFFERAGMTRVRRGDTDGPAYFWARAR